MKLTTLFKNYNKKIVSSRLILNKNHRNKSIKTLSRYFFKNVNIQRYTSTFINIKQYFFIEFLMRIPIYSVSEPENILLSFI